LAEQHQAHLLLAVAVGAQGLVVVAELEALEVRL
jgi:hypothetical protein